MNTNARETGPTLDSAPRTWEVISFAPRELRVGVRYRPVADI